MVLTDKHVSDEDIAEMIEDYSDYGDCQDDDVVKALLELKQRRAEDRARKAGAE